MGPRYGKALWRRRWIVRSLTGKRAATGAAHP